jgi:hypothetical protein
MVSAAWSDERKLNYGQTPERVNTLCYKEMFPKKSSFLLVEKKEESKGNFSQ